MKLFLTRHGQTDWNTKRCVCGRTEAQLTDLGRAQAAQVGEQAAQAGVNVILASPMDRAQETAAIIAQKVGVPVLTDPLLIEQDFGTFEGRSVDDPEYREKRKSLLWHYPEGESTAQLIHRAYTIIEKVRDTYPDKRVLLSNPDAGCPMAEQMDREVIEQVKENYPDYTVVAYINTTAELKTVCDVCVTSSSAEKVIRKIDNDKILFIPDCNLGDYVSRQVPEKTFKLLSGGCPTHARLTARDVQAAKAKHPRALFLVHPECVPAVVEQADYVGSTTGIMNYAMQSDAKEFIIGTENSICEHLQMQCPDKRFYPLSKDCVCHNMKATTLGDVLGCLQGTAGQEIIVPPEIAEKAVRCIDRMMELSQ